MQKKSLITSISLLILVALGGVFVFMRAQQNTVDTRIVATTMAQTDVFDRLGIPLVGVPTSTEKMPTRYANVPKVGNHVSINFEQIIKVKPSVVYVDSELTDEYAGKLKEQHINMQALNFQNYAKLRTGITQLGKTYHKQKQAQRLNQAIALPKSHLKKPVKVLILMGMPGGSFLVANDQSYIGDLVKRAGGTVISGDPNSIYTTANPQAIAEENPDVVIRLAHAMPASVKKAFVQTFKQAPYHTLTATQKGHVYDVTAPDFSPSANLHVKTAYAKIQKWLEAAQ